jgi:hypothetical protein
MGFLEKDVPSANSQSRYLEDGGDRTMLLLLKDLSISHIEQ